LNSRFVLSLSTLAAIICGFAWQWGHAGPILSLALIPLVLIQRNRLSRFLVALAYYLAGSHGIPLASAVFFGPGGHYAEGIALWIGSSALLALGWTFADRPWKAALVLVFDALIPPLAFFDWMSPLTASGVLFPGLGIAGVALLLIGLSVASTRKRFSGLILIEIAMMTIFANLASELGSCAPYLRHADHPAIVGLNLHLGPSTHSILKNYQRMQSWVATADAHPEAKVILLPETLLTWWSGNQHYVESHVPAGQTWLVGASIPLHQPGMFADGIEEVTRHGSRMIFASVLPVPVSMWRPWHKPSGDSVGLLDYKAFWWQKPVTIAGQRTWAEICYDQLLPFSWLEAALYQPQVILLTNNEWWAKGTGIPRIQRASAWAWGRLMGSQEIEAENS
jgi:hypothetical protein